MRVFDHAWSYFPEQVVGPTRFLPAPIVFEQSEGVKGYNDITPRLGLAYDLFGTGKTVRDLCGIRNANPALTYNPAYSAATAWPRPTAVLQPRFLKLSAQIDF